MTIIPAGVENCIIKIRGSETIIVNLLKYNLVTDVTEYLQNIRSAGCESFVEIPTRICIKGARCEISCLDHIYSSIAPDDVETYVIKLGISHHFATLAKVTTKPDQKK